MIQVITGRLLSKSTIAIIVIIAMKIASLLVNLLCGVTVSINGTQINTGAMRGAGELSSVAGKETNAVFLHGL